MSIQNTKKYLGIEVALLTVRRRLELIILVVWIAYLLYAFFVMKLQKKNYGVRRLTVETPPTPNTSQCVFSWTTLPLPERTYFMDDP